MSYRYERYREQPRSSARSCLIALVVLVWVLVLGCLAVRYFVRPWLTDFVNGSIARAIDPALPSGLDPNEALRRGLEQVPIPIAVPPGELAVTEAQANAFLSEYRTRLSNVDDVRVRFVPGEVQAIVTVQGLSGTARIVPTVRDGRIVAERASLDQPLGSLLDINDLLGALQDRINSELNTQGRRVVDVRIEDGVAVVVLE